MYTILYQLLSCYVYKQWHLKYVILLLVHLCYAGIVTVWMGDGLGRKLK